MDKAKNKLIEKFTTDKTDLENILGQPIVEANSLASINGITYSDTSTGTCPIVVTRTYTVTDICDNSASVSRVFNIKDTLLEDSNE